MIRIIEVLIVLFFLLFLFAFLSYFFSCNSCNPESVLKCREILVFEKYSMLMLLFLFIVYFICLKFSKKSKSS